MGARIASAYATTDLPLVTTAETVVATLSGVSTNQPGQTVSFLGHLSLLTGTATTAVILRVRRDSVTGTVCGEIESDSLSAAAGANESHEFYTEDQNAGEFSGRTYVLTAQQVGATGNGSALTASLTCVITP